MTDMDDWDDSVPYPRWEPVRMRIHFVVQRVDGEDGSRRYFMMCGDMNFPHGYTPTREETGLRVCRMCIDLMGESLKTGVGLASHFGVDELK